MRLKDKVAIITGGAYGLGKAYAAGYSREGAKIAIADIDIEGARATAEEIVQSGGEAFAIRADISVVADTVDMARKTFERFGSIDILVNNAAMLGRVRVSRGTPFWELDLSEWDKVMEVNVKGTFLCTRAVFPYMKEQKSGRIINITSPQFHKGGGKVRYAHYVASKGAVIGLTRAFAQEMGEFNVNVNCIGPGATFTEDPSDTAAFESRKKAAERRIIKRVQYAEDLVGTAIYLASSESELMTGQTLIVDGGEVML
jgi:NAD(P)-dependent dehydrogenase (short-subunit alcohol dehydrogenase family)